MAHFVKDARRIGVYGASGSGKSTRVKDLMRGAERVVVFDPMDEYASHRFARCTSLARVLAGMKRGWAGGFRIAYVPPSNREAEALHKLALLLMQAQAPYRDERDARKIVLVVEELNLSFPVAALPRDIYGMGELCSRGRHYGIEVIGVTQRLAEVNTRFRGNTSEAYFFRQSDHVDVQAVGRMLGPQWAKHVQELQDHHYLRRVGGQITDGKNILRR